MGRSGLDLYANDVGAPFTEIKSFAAYVGGSPTNIAVGARRLGLKTALVTAVGQDPVGDFILKFLEDEGVDIKFTPRKPDTRSAAVVLGIEPPDKFPLVFYRDNAPDNLLSHWTMSCASPIGSAKIPRGFRYGLEQRPTAQRDHSSPANRQKNSGHSGYP